MTDSFPVVTVSGSYPFSAKISDAVLSVLSLNLDVSTTVDALSFDKVVVPLPLSTTSADTDVAKKNAAITALARP